MDCVYSNHGTLQNNGGYPAMKMHFQFDHVNNYSGHNGASMVCPIAMVHQQARKRSYEDAAHDFAKKPKIFGEVTPVPTPSAEVAMNTSAVEHISTQVAEQGYGYMYGSMLAQMHGC